MSIIKDLEIKINNGNAELSENVYVYQKDRGVELRLKLNMIKTNYRSAVKSTIFDVNNIYSAATIMKPNGDVISRKKSVVIDDTITFTIDNEFTDEVDEVGVYKVQFHLFDDEDNRITIPPIAFEVKELLGIVNEEEMNHHEGIVDSSSTNFCTVADNGREMEIFSNGKYIRTYWNSGDLITSIKLNKIEEGIEYLDNKLSNYLDDNDYINIEMIPYSNEADSSIFTIKDALDKLLYVDLTMSLNTNVSTTLEKGRAIDGVTFNWNYNKRIVSQIFNNTILDIDTRLYMYDNPLSSNKTFTLIANDGVKELSKSISFNFLNGVYWGVSSEVSYDSNFIIKLSKDLASNRNKTFTVNCGANQYIYYCIPTNYGTPVFTVDGFSGGFSKVDTIQFKNIYGYTESYDIYKSTNNNLGITTVVVS